MRQPRKRHQLDNARVARHASRRAWTAPRPPAGRTRPAAAFVCALLGLLAAAFAPVPARATVVLHVTAGGVKAERGPALDGAYALPAPPAPALATASRVRAAARAAATLRAAGRDPVTRTVKDAFARNAIDAATRDRYLGSWSAALRTFRALRGQRRTELGYVVGVVRSLAAQNRLAVRLAPLFVILDRNRQWWSKAGPPAPGARLTFGASRLIFQYFPGEGLQFHPLANFGQLNGYWSGKRNDDLRSLVDDLLTMRVERSG